VIEYRLARATDAPELKALTDLFSDCECNAVEAVEQSLRDNVQEIVCVAAEEDRLVGFCCGQIAKSMCYSVHNGEIYELFILPEYRRHGIAKHLIELAESELRARGVESFRLMTGRDNHAAQSLYRACGYVQTSEMLFAKRPARRS